MSAALKMPEPFVSEVQELADRLADAMIETSATALTLSAAEAHRDKISARVSDLAGQRNAIANRRSDGHGDAEDGPQLALIQIDTEQLNGMMPDALARVAEARSSYDAAAALAGRLRAEIAGAEARAARQILVSYAETLGERLLETLKAIEVESKRAGLGGAPPWGPGRELREKLKRISLERRE